MNRLTEIIGPAPAELPLEVFMNTRLRDERKRIEHSLSVFRSGVEPSWKKQAAKRALGPKTKGQAVRLKNLQETLKLSGLSLQELADRIKEDMQRG